MLLDNVLNIWDDPVPLQNMYKYRLLKCKNKMRISWTALHHRFWCNIDLKYQTRTGVPKYY
jgi:hypothetical protein